MAGCEFNAGVKLIYSCSGAADVGEIADRAVRVLVKEGFASGSCIAAVGAGLFGYIQSAKGAEVNIAVDGCQMSCASRILESTGIKPVSFIVTGMGFEKGNSPVTDDAVETVCSFIREGKTTENETGDSGNCSCSCGG